MKTRTQILVLSAVALGVVAGGIAIWKLTPKLGSSSGETAQIYDYIPSASSKIPGGIPLRPMDNEIFEALARDHFSREQLLDLFPEKPYHAKLTRDAIRNFIIAILIDVNRDGTWDEKWDLRTDGCTRHDLTVKNSNESSGFTLRGGRWVAF